MTLCDRRRLKHSCSAALSARSSLSKPSTPAAHAGPSAHQSAGGGVTSSVRPCSQATIGGSGSVGEGVVHAVRQSARAASRNLDGNAADAVNIDGRFLFDNFDGV
jgi:hypothetical protein